jgi:cell division protein FtsB
MIRCAMVIRQAIRRFLARILGPMLGCLAVAYFTYHLVNGERSLLAWRHMDVEISEAETRLVNLRHEREVLERRASLLRPDHLDPDMLEERARTILNFARPDEIVVIAPRRPKS